MIIAYRILTIVIVIFLPLILVWRVFKKKEILNRSKEKICFFGKKRNEGKLVWFHGASVGEIKSVIPLIEIYEKKK
jgi:3-deoxy-D-manno-octulosonic-acid transferase